MNTKKYVTVAVAVVMALSCLGVFFASEDAKGADDPNAGDVWGMGYSLNDEQLIKYLLQDDDDDDDDDAKLELEDGTPVRDKEGLKKYFKERLTAAGVSVNKLDFNASYSYYIMAEVVSKNDDGYIINFAWSILIKADVDFLGEFLGKEAKLKDSVIAGAYITGTMVANKDRIVSKVSISGESFFKIEGDNNLPILNIAILKGTFELSATSGFDATIEFDEGKGFDFLPKEKIEMKVAGTAQTYGHGFLDGKADGILELIKEAPDEISGKLESMFDIKATAAVFAKSAFTGDVKVDVKAGDEIEYELEFNDDDKLLMDEIEFEVDFDMDKDKKELLGGSLIYQDGMKLTGDNVDKVKNGVSDAIREYEEIFFGKDVKLIYGGKTVTKKFGDKIGIPEVPDGKIFAGWNIAKEGKFLISEDTVMKSDIKAEPMFVTEITKLTLEDYKEKGYMAYFKIDKADLVIPDDVLKATAEGVLIVEGPGYKWIFAGGSYEAGATVNASIELKAEGHASFEGKKAVVLDFKAKGKMPDGTKVTYEVSGKLSANAMVDVFVNDGNNKLEFVGKAYVNAEGKLTFDVPHCSEYVLVESNMPTTASAKSDGEFPIMMIAIAAVAVVVVAGVAVFFLRR